ncbi:MAG: hypothetical protein FWG92_02990 [Leptospirales bacterium]|nr:hypothetical protein [Leptospirales bacterium]
MGLTIIYLHYKLVAMSASPDTAMASAFDVLDLDKTKTRGKGAIICLYDKLAHLKDNLLAVPVEYI